MRPYYMNKADNIRPLHRIVLTNTAVATRYTLAFSNHYLLNGDILHKSHY
jgi:hypothetical protein